MIPVRLIAKNGKSVCLEYRDDSVPHRCMLPVEVVRESRGRLPLWKLQMGAEVGLDWGDVLRVADFGHKLNEALRLEDIWTAEDMDNNQVIVLDVIKRVFRTEVLARVYQLEECLAAHSYSSDSE